MSVIEDVAERLDLAREGCRLQRIAEAKEAHYLAVSTTHQDMVDDGFAVGNPRSFKDEGAEPGAEGAEPGAEGVEDGSDAIVAVGEIAWADEFNAENAALAAALENVVALSSADEKAKERAEQKVEYLRKKQAYKLEQERIRAEEMAEMAERVRIEARIAQRAAAFWDIDLKRFSMKK